jgi:hypothetical protein
MFKSSDPYTYTLTGGLTMAGGDGPVGLFAAQYKVAHYDDVQMLSGTAQAGVANQGFRKYLVTVTQRVMIYNRSGTDLRPQTDMTRYENYPAVLNTLYQMPLDDGITAQLVSYSPQTVNSQVQVSGTTGSSSGQSSSNATSNTVGSSTSQTNSFGVSVGFFGDMMTGGVTADHSSTTTNEQSATTSNEAGRSASQESSSSNYMSIKDWGAYSLVNPSTSCPSWVFGQEYPWNAIDCRKTNGQVKPVQTAKATRKARAMASDAPTQQVEILVPDYQKARLYDGSAVYPPSQLSMFGINFVVQAQWLVTVDNTVTDTLTIGHTLNYFTASHLLETVDKTTDVHVYIDDTPTLLKLDGDDISVEIDPGTMALAPAGSSDAPPVIGFIPSKFVRQPAPAASGKQPVPFSIFSTTNTLIARDTTVYPATCDVGMGFAPSETALNATLGGNCTKLVMTLLFKITDAVNDYTLFLKHWKTSAMGVTLTITVNGNTANQMVKNVNSFEAEGGENNLLSIVLRNQNYASVDYSDFLTPGLNSIEIAITPNDGKAAGYALRAVSLEAS